MRLVYLGLVELNNLNMNKCKQLQAGKMHKDWMEQVKRDWAKVLSKKTGNTGEVKSERVVNSWDIFSNFK